MIRSLYNTNHAEKENNRVEKRKKNWNIETNPVIINMLIKC